MEQRKEIKDGVKQRLIEFMTEQITKEESFVDLKNELIEELLIKKQIEEPVKESLEEVLENAKQTEENLSNIQRFGFPFNKQAIEDRLITMAEEKGLQQSFITKKRNAKETIEQIQEGKLPSGLKGFTEDFDNKPDFNEIYERFNNPTSSSPLLPKNPINKKITVPRKKTSDYIITNGYDGSNFTDYALKYKYTNSEKIAFRKSIVEFIKSNETKFWVETFKNEPNFYKKYSLTNSSLRLDAPDNVTFGSARNDFKLSISVIYNNITKSYYIDNFDCVLGSQFMMNTDLGLIFAVEVLQLMDKLDKENNLKFAEDVFKSVESAEPINETTQVVREAMRQVSKNVRAPKVVRDGIVKPKRKAEKKSTKPRKRK